MQPLPAQEPQPPASRDGAEQAPERPTATTAENAWSRGSEGRASEGGPAEEVPAQEDTPEAAPDDGSPGQDVVM
jgi:hypothetical protein